MGDIITPPPISFTQPELTPQISTFEPEDDLFGDVESISTTSISDADDDDDSDDDSDVDDDSEDQDVNPDDVILSSAMAKISKGEIFEGDTPFFQPYDILPWWGWAIVFFLLGIAFVTVVYFLFYQPTDLTPVTPPTPITPIPAPPQPQPVPEPDSSRKMYCLIGEDQGRKVVIRVSDPSLCRRTVLLTDEEYENSL